MGNIREIKSRILSVKKTKKITQAMKMVSAAKFKRYHHKLENCKDYIDCLGEVFDDLMSRIEPDFIPELFVRKNRGKKICVVISGDRGLCGGFNSGVNRAVLKFLDEAGKKTEIYAIGTKAGNYLKNKQISVKKIFEIESMKNDEIREFLKILVEDYKQSNISEIWLIYNKFISAISNEVSLKKVIPFEFSKIKQDDISINSEFYYEPSRSVIDEFLIEVLNNYFRKAIVESKTSEEGSRMTAMETATDNAVDFIDKLTVVFNRTRQAIITKEISEIVSGIEALAG